MMLDNMAEKCHKDANKSTVPADKKKKTLRLEEKKRKIQRYGKHVCSRYSSDISTWEKGDDKTKDFLHTDVAFKKATTTTNRTN